MAISAQTNVPQLPPFKVVTVGKNYTYLWPTVRKKYQGRIIDAKGTSSVGKIKGGGQTGLVVWKDEFIAEHPELLAYNVYREEVTTGEHSTTVEYRFVFRPKEGVATANSMQVQQYYQAGATWLCDQLLQSSPLLVAMNRCFMDDNRNLKLLALSYYTLLHHTIDFSEYLHFCADTRLAWQSSMTEHDINALLQDISDVELNHFFATLQSLCARRQNRNSRYYALDLVYPHNLTTQLRTGQLTLTTNFSALDRELRKLLKDPALNSTQKQNLLRRWVQTQEDSGALLIFNAQSGMPHLFNTFQTDLYSLEELCSFLRYQSLPQEQAKQQVLSLALDSKNELEGTKYARTYGLSPRENFFVKAASEDEGDTSSRLREKSSTVAAAEKVQLSLNSLGSNSGLGSIQGLTDQKTELNNHNSDQAAKRLNRDSSSLSHSVDLNDSGLAQSTLRTLSASEALKQNQGGVSSIVSSRVNSLGLSFGDEDAKTATETILVTARNQQMINTLRYLLQQKQSFLWTIPAEHQIFKHLLQRHERQMLLLNNYNAEQQCFCLTFDLNQHYPEYDVSSERVAGTTGGLFTGQSRFLPRKMLASLHVHLIFDLKPLLALKEQQESLSEDYAVDGELNSSPDEDIMDFIGSEDSPTSHFWNSSQVLRASTQGTIDLNDEQCAALDSIMELLERHVTRSSNTALATYMASTAAYDKEMEAKQAHSWGDSNVAPAMEHLADDSDSFLDVPDDSEEDFFSVPDDDDAPTADMDNSADVAKADDTDADDSSFLDIANDDDNEPLEPSSYYLSTGEIDLQSLSARVDANHYDSEILDFEDEDEPQFIGLSAQESARIQRYLMQLLHSKEAVKSGSLQILVTDQLANPQEALQAANYLKIGTSAFDLMSFDVFKTEQAQLNPLTMEFKPILKQLLRGKNFVIFLALSLHIMLQASLNERDRQYGSSILRQRLNIKNVPQYLQSLQKIVAERKDNGFTYKELPQELRSLLGYLNVATPSHEVFSDSASDTEIRLARDK
ncbi:MAG TPA: hypothetical protein H9850_01765 [Candidatus Anaerobiospirillum pullistercoris]|uniref:Uncharacterized protein n=1 Tax=Candidatus Anaerobiospirillum pullistercoris TaxID=2838452 RepID=A0A9D2AZQ1_9GAMM|nr:hypothetical protein [Candidatus Anaerobiospirillum pullistercoris]